MLDDVSVMDAVWGDIMDYIPNKALADVALKVVTHFTDAGIDCSESEYLPLRKAAKLLDADESEHEEEEE